LQSPENHHIFAIHLITAELRDNKAPDDDACTKFDCEATGCVAIFEDNESSESSMADEVHDDH
jgi:hypothetical protein